ncbi:hypothetical protein SAY86_023039 [Trapa natans]|uniref:Uncharacterized protein n=1 Tax=Trapa natans TaxID=22666 RepID=A0AAN7R5B0_TRANT|nr:hypothetical protein SAY86_023039 [Trapa natans]
MGCCTSRDTGKRGYQCHSSTRVPALPPSLGDPPPKEEDTAVKEVLPEMDFPGRKPLEVTRAGDSRRFQFEDDLPETHMFFNNLEDAVELETLCEYYKMYSTSRETEETSGTPWENRRQQRLNTHGSRNRSPIKEPREHPSAGRASGHSRSQPISPTRSAQELGPEFQGAWRRELSGVPKARQCNMRSGISQRLSRSQSPVRRARRRDKPSWMAGMYPVKADIGRGWSWESAGCQEDAYVERTEETSEEVVPEDITNFAEQQNESLIDNPHVSLECFIFL